MLRRPLRTDKSNQSLPSKMDEKRRTDILKIDSSSHHIDQILNISPPPSFPPPLLHIRRRQHFLNANEPNSGSFDGDGSDIRIHRIDSLSASELPLMVSFEEIETFYR